MFIMGENEKIDYSNDIEIPEPEMPMSSWSNDYILKTLQMEIQEMDKYPKLRTKDYNSGKIDVIVCAKDSILTLGLCLSSLVRQRDIGKIIVIHPHSDKITPFIAKGFGVKTVEEPLTSCLAWARKLGVKYTTSKWVSYVDADIILGKDHLWYLSQVANLYGNRPIAVEGILTKKRMVKSILPIGRPYKHTYLEKGDRGFTHNTIFNREVLESWRPQYTHAWEDWLLTQHVLSHEKSAWIRTKTKNVAFNLQDYDFFTRVAWASAGERMVKKLTYKFMFKSILINILRSGKMLVKLRDVTMFLEQIMIAVGKTHGYFKWNKHLELQRPQWLQQQEQEFTI